MPTKEPKQCIQPEFYAQAYVDLTTGGIIFNKSEPIQWRSWSILVTEEGWNLSAGRPEQLGVTTLFFRLKRVRYIGCLFNGCDR